MKFEYSAAAKAVALHGVLVTAIGCSSPAVEHIETESAVAVEVETAKVGEIEGSIDVTGVVAPAPGAEWVITAPESARIAEVTKAEGDAVKAGDVLVRFDIPTLAAGVSGARAGVSQARARLETTRAAVARLTGLVDRGVAARREVEEAQRDQAEAEAALAKAESDLQAAQSLAARATVTARFNGVVAKRWHNAGDMVEAVATDPILRIIDPGQLQVLASVAASQLPRIVPGRSGHVTGPDGASEQDVTVITRPVQLDPLGSVAEVRLAFKGPNRYASGTPLQVSIGAEKKANAILIPSAAIIREGDGTFVMIVKADNKAHRQQVELGLGAGDDVEVLKGVAAGDRVIVKGQHELPDGAAVTIER